MTFVKKYSTQFVSFLLTLILCFSIYSIYSCFYSGLGVMICLATILSTTIFFLVCFYTEKHKYIGGFLVMILLSVHVSLYLYVCRVGFIQTRGSFLEWLLTKGGENQEGSVYLWAACFFFSSFFSVTIYYFSNALYRMFFLTLASLIPAVVYLKVLEEMNNVFLILIASLNVILFMIHRRRRFKKGETIHSKNTMVSCGTFILLLFFCTAAIPKNAETPYYEVFEDAFLGGDTSSPLSDSISQLSSFSNDAGGFFIGFDTPNRKLYTVVSHNKMQPYYYLKRQVFDLYDYEKNRWYPSEKFSTANLFPEQIEELGTDLSLSLLLEALKATDSYEPGFLSKYGLENLTTLDSISPATQLLDFRAENFSTVFYLAPARVISVDAGEEEPYFATLNGAFLREGAPHADNFTYSVSFYDDLDNYNTWKEAGGLNISGDKYSLMLNEMHQILSQNQDPLKEIVSSHLQEDTQALQYKQLCRENRDGLPDEVVDLAHRITADCTYDYEKADALVDYFNREGFVYQLQYRQKEKGPKYFLFTSKKGSCSDYASAFTHMARACGLTVRYAEGYVTEMSEPGVYVIKSRDSHAYPEVYLPGAGWTVFEPTVARMDNMKPRFSLSHFFTDLKMDYGLMGVVIYFLVIGFVILSVIRFVFPFFTELYFRLSLRLSNPDKATILCYNRILKLTGKSFVPDADSKTPYELSCFYKSIGCDIYKLTTLVETLLYADLSVSPEDKALLPGIYSSARKALKRHRKASKKRNNLNRLRSNRKGR